ncbi:nuclear transcription factor Y subunit C-3-like [Macadamia integrifolia]|uniref:nuclear transcription factor Y subunit C-3-like n=1 Tax=Macadamia integrifolia TaxID=60698 RepID=UPI001C4E6CBB|nr:nuclear transcription factor Y subunit C-3-like [Macadamia integrifolia]
MDSNQSRHFASSHNSMDMPPPPIFPIDHRQPSMHELHNLMLMSHPSMLLRDPQAPHQVDEETMREHHLQLWKQNMRLFWQQQLLEVNQISEFKQQHQLPLARIKRIMKSDEDVKMISADAPILFAKACELFISELTLRSWSKSEEYKRRTLLRYDIFNAINQGDVLNFLLRIFPKDDTKEEEPPRGDMEFAELVPHNGGVNFPMMDLNCYLQNLNAESMVREQEIPPHSMVQPPVPQTLFFYGPPGPQ